MIKSNSERAKTAIMFLWILFAIGIMVVVSDAIQVNLIKKALNGGTVTQLEGAANDARQVIISWLYTIMYLISMLCFILWSGRAYYNLHQKVSGLKYKNGWGIVSWFVPVLSLFRPYEIVRETVTETSRILEKNNIIIERPLSINLLNWWWMLYIIKIVSIGIIRSGITAAESIHGIYTYTFLATLSDALGLVVTLLFIRVVVLYSKYECKLSEIQEVSEENPVYDIEEEDYADSDETVNISE